MIKSIVLVGLGGAIGSVLRYLTSLFVTKYFENTLPLATFTVNVLGCLLIGVLLGLFERQQLTSLNLQLLFIVGFCGGFTTFSTFAAENLNLFQTNHSLLAFAYIGASIFVGLFSVWLGLALTK